MRYSSLRVAQDIAFKHGVDNMFAEIYTMRREYEDIFDSVEYTMQYLGLYDEWYNTWVNKVK